LSTIDHPVEEKHPSLFNGGVSDEEMFFLLLTPGLKNGVAYIKTK
jgi:hypothetical protein